MNWFQKIFGPSPIKGEAGYSRGYANVRSKVERGDMSKETAYAWWLNSDPPRDDYDRGVLEALADSGFKAPDDPS